jgi:hypothetical protein
VRRGVCAAIGSHASVRYRSTPISVRRKPQRELTRFHKTKLACAVKLTHFGYEADERGGSAGIEDHIMPGLRFIIIGV